MKESYIVQTNCVDEEGFAQPHVEHKFYSEVDIETLRKKLIEDIGDYENPFISEEYFNPTNAYEKLENLRDFVINVINKRFGVE